MSPRQFTDEQHEALATIADFDHVFVVLDGGWVANPTDAIVDAHIRIQASSLYSPETLDVDSYATELDGWNLPLSGLTGQYGYTGPWLHDSEQISGAVAEAVLAMPGYWVAIYGQHTMGDAHLHPDGSEPCETHIEGWTLAHRPFTESTEGTSS